MKAVEGHRAPEAREPRSGVRRCKGKDGPLLTPSVSSALSAVSLVAHQKVMQLKSGGGPPRSKRAASPALPMFPGSNTDAACPVDASVGQCNDSLGLGGDTEIMGGND